MAATTTAPDMRGASPTTATAMTASAASAAMTASAAAANKFYV
jgi:hypothetical protein